MIPIAKPLLGEEEFEGVKKVLESGMLAQGKWVSDFESDFSSYIEAKHSSAVSNGTAALDLVMRAVGIDAEDEVIVPGFTFIATANSVIFQKAKPVFADVLDDPFNIDPKDVAEKITPKTKAVIAVHLFGQTADMKTLTEICEDKKIALIEDACQAHGAKQNSRMAGNLGTAGCFSFYPTKNMTTGEGGMITTNDAEIDRKVRILRDQGQTEKYVHAMVGFNFRMTNIAAAIGIEQLKKLPEFVRKRQENAKKLNDGIGRIDGLTVPVVKENNEHAYHQYVIKVEENFKMTRDELAAKLREKGIGTAVHYPTPIHLQPAYRSLGYPEELCPVSRSLSNKVLSLPVHPAVTEENIKEILSALEEVSS